MKTNLETALITGGSQGLGLALAKALARRKVAVALVARDAKRLAGAVREIESAGGTAFGIVADMGDKSAIHEISGQVAMRFGAVDLLVHNASELGPTPMPLLLDTACEDLERVLAVNLVGPFRLTKAIAGPMALRGSGRVLFVSSDAAVEAYPRWGAYGASKAAADQLARVFAAELSAHGIWLSVVDPGEMNTEMHAKAMPNADPKTLFDPAVVASRIVALLDASSTVASGSRIVLAQGSSS